MTQALAKIILLNIISNNQMMFLIRQLLIINSYLLLKTKYLFRCINARQSSFKLGDNCELNLKK